MVGAEGETVIVGAEPAIVATPVGAYLEAEPVDENVTSPDAPFTASLRSRTYTVVGGTESSVGGVVKNDVMVGVIDKEAA